MNNGRSRMQLSVQEFFSQLNWQGLAIATLDSGQHRDPVSRLELLVGDYFRLFPWEGTPTVGSVPKSSSPPAIAASTEEEVTLSDLLDAF